MSDTPQRASDAEVAYRLRLLRKSKGLSLVDVEEKTGVSNSYVSQIEHGHETNPSVGILMDLVGLYGVGIDDLYRSADRSES